MGKTKQASTFCQKKGGYYIRMLVRNPGKPAYHDHRIDMITGDVIDIRILLGAGLQHHNETYSGSHE
ncbi:hypothetical protein OZL92_07985 [Bacillus sonorensis]|uniref:Uncharacterized protein n=1 Tax=Bacillus sonorensis L12 TaxID=1274524 RepID=M5PD51_9BACI|nr:MULTISPECIES: hypothetical protein [Bacillus]EME73482.1 hypothetical protein BSONL12_17219 [Bacillus sonorensis L12]MBG9914457.1 hypothetical protein [Bacillus sonorensis]MCF7616281.1 hypothetical protein [Bacillus sonorensis]MCY7857792.1 hypothetical protein [Bacillus sonorensis]MCY8023703.1 hypothetical protein [Bacillus sonorensis]